MSAPRCMRCHRKLKDPESIAVGIGPTCLKKLNLTKKKAAIKGRRTKPVNNGAQLSLFQLLEIKDVKNSVF